MSLDLTVAVVILNWNGKNLLEQFLPSVINYSENIAEIIVADNASTDDSLLFIQKNFPQVKIIRNQENGGYAKGYNDALKQVKADLYVLLNSDVEVTAGWLLPVIEQFRQNKLLGACQPKIKWHKNKKSFEYAGAAGGYIDSLGYPFCRGRIFDTLEEDQQQYEDNRDVFWATGACLFVRSTLFHELQGFDEDFFAHMEEIDLCWRMQNKGYRVRYCAQSTVYHVGGETLNKTQPAKTYLNYRNNLFLLYKNYPSYRVYFVLFLRLSLDGISGLRSLFLRQPAHLVAILKAHLSFYKNFGKMKTKRLSLPHLPLSSLKGVYHRSIVWAYFVGKRRFFSRLS